MEIGEEIVLRPRFTIHLNCDHEMVLRVFSNNNEGSGDFLVSCLDNHVFIKIPKEKQHFWSPQLDLEILSFEEGKSEVHGLFGPKPAVWTLFMFFHFIVGSLFIASGMWAYTNASLDTPFTVQIVIMALLTITWFVLYFSGRMGKKAGKKEMISMHSFLTKKLDSFYQL
jgi:hypothetical protein